MVPEAKLVETPNGLVPEGEGWFVLNARDAVWVEREESEHGSLTDFEGEPEFPELGLNIRVLQPGQPACMYHRENAQEDFLVLAGEALLLVEGEERPLRAWDLVHCPAWTEHVIVGAGSGPCVVVAVGARAAEDDILYPVADVAKSHDASVLEETKLPREAYARFSPWTRRPFRDGDLPEW